MLFLFPVFIYSSKPYKDGFDYIFIEVMIVSFEKRAAVVAVFCCNSWEGLNCKNLETAAIQSNLSIADMLYSRHLVIGDSLFLEPAEFWSNSHKKTSM